VEVTTPSNQMDLDQDIPVINQKDKNDSPEERHKWRMLELPPAPKGNNRDIPASVQELVYGGKAASVGTSPKSLDRHHELISSSEEKKKLAQGKENSPVEAPQASTSKSAKQSKANLKEQSEGKTKGKGKGKAQVEQALPAELQDSQEREDSHGQCVQYEKHSDGIQKQGRGKIEPIFSKGVDLAKLVSQIGTCNKGIITKLKAFEYIQKKLGNEILHVKESQKTILGLESVNKDNIVSLTQICARIESKVTVLNQQYDNYVSFITRQLKELRIQVQNLENSTGHNAALFQEQLEKSDKARLELKEDIQSSINNISLNNELPLHQFLTEMC
ncbi:hypothetical protein O181_101919, partial [Austropuccinia psidii MF-1]|nr:hypothetical protein [Austropuccinia psidii MF-1]